MNKNKKRSRHLKSSRNKVGRVATTASVGASRLHSSLEQQINTLLKQMEGRFDGCGIAMDYIEHPESWSKPVHTRGYAMSCVAHSSSGCKLVGMFEANLKLKHWQLGDIRIAIYHPFIYPGRRQIFFPISYVTETQELFTETVIFHAEHEPSQRDANMLLKAIFAYILLSGTNIREEIGWNTSYLLRPMFDALALQIHQREAERLQNKLKLNKISKTCN